MSRPTRRLPFVGHRLLVALQVFLLLATLFAPIPVAAEEPSSDPGASPTPSTEPAATPEPTPEPTAEPTAEPTPEPTAEATPEPTAEPPTSTPDPSPEPTAEAPPRRRTQPPSRRLLPRPNPRPAGTPTIKSDLEDYPPGGLVTLTGTGWQPGESVHIYVNDDWGSSWSRHVDVTADASGAITDQFNLPNWFVALYSVVATGAESGQALATFTDASLTVKRGPTGSPPNLTFNVGVVRGFATNTCTSGGDPRPAVTVSTDAGSTVTGLGSGAFVRLTAPVGPTSPSGYEFVNWSAEGDSPTTGFPKTTLSICVRNPSGSLDDVYRVNYQRSTTTTLTRSIGSASNAYGDPLTFTATVTSAAGNPSNVGTVTFKDGAATLCAAVVLAGNQAPCDGSSLNVAGSPHSITAVYSGVSGPPASGASTSAPLAQTITKATLIVDANDKSRDYGDPNPAFDATITGFKNGETLATSGVAGSPLCSSTATSSSPVSGSPFAITCALGSLTAGNYTFTFTPGELTIGKATLAVDADDKSKIFDDADPAFTWTYSGFVGGEDAEDAAISGAAECDREAGENVLDGPYAITCTPGDLTSANYDFVTGEAGAFTIDPAPSVTDVTCPAGPYTYSGAAQTPCSVSVTGAGGLDLSPTPDYTNNVNAGTATASYTYGWR